MYRVMRKVSYQVSVTLAITTERQEVKRQQSTSETLYFKKAQAYIEERIHSHFDEGPLRNE